MTHFIYLGHIYTQGAAFRPKAIRFAYSPGTPRSLCCPGNPSTPLSPGSPRGPGAPGSPIPGGQLDQHGLFHQEVLVTPFTWGSPVHHHPRQHIGKNESVT